MELENRFFKLKYISDRDWLGRTLHEDFCECGKSGLLFNKKMTVESLLQCRRDRNIVILDFECRKISDNCYLVHYVTESDNKRYYRTSIWVKEADIKLLFHQATELNE